MVAEQADGRISKREVERLGDRLRASRVPAKEDLDLLQRIRREYDGALAQAQQVIEQALPGVQATTRLKTVQTLVEKLKRHPTMHLYQVQDIAGARIVQRMRLEEQDSLVERIADAFPAARIVDRRPLDNTSHGYRAVHVIAKVDGRLVEIQVRTALQDRWAQIVERLGDAWGRQIRYGELPTDPEAPVAHLSRRRVLDFVQTIGRFLAVCEEDPKVTCGAAESALERLARLMSQARTG